MQTDINSIYAWSQDNNLKLNVDKCSVMSYAPRDPVLKEYSLGGKPFECVQSVRDLELRFNSELKFNYRIIATCKSTVKSLGLIKRQSKLFDQRDIICNLYNAFVRSKLETCCAVWNPHNELYITMLERIQNQFL